MVTVARVESWSGKALTVRLHWLWIAVIIAALTFALLPGVVSADLSGTRQQDRDNRRCARYGQHYDRDGIITAREQARLTKIHCKRSGGTWVSDRFYQA